MSSSADVAAGAYDGIAAPALARALGIPRLALFASVASTMDVAHALAAEGAESGTVVLADAQHGGRGRGGRRWMSPSGSGVWCTVLERPTDVDALRVLSLRVGLFAAEALAPLARVPIGVKWPNDLVIGARKLGGVLVEARWRDDRPEWVAIGVGVNVRPPAAMHDVAALAPGVVRVEALGAVVGAVRAAAACVGSLTDAELARYATHDAVRGRRAVVPVPGIAEGVAPDGRLLVRADDGAVAALDQATVTYADG